ncbi:MAG: alpha/beta fold hydrolase, partial [Alphaproteobacteria bacterium]
DHLGCARAVVGGISMGGMIALGLAARGDPRVAGIIGMATALRFGDAASWAQRIAAVEAGGLEAIADETMARWFARRTHAARTHEILGWRTLFTRGPVAGYLANCRALATADLDTRAQDIRVPVLLLAGAEDPGPGPQPTAALAARLPDARAVTIADAAHLLAIDQPAATADAVLDFTSRCMT